MDSANENLLLNGMCRTTKDVSMRSEKVSNLLRVVVLALFICFPARPGLGRVLFSIRFRRD
jgi:hypothetical protein